MKIKKETYSEWGTKVSTHIIEGTTLKKLAAKYPSARIEPDGSFYITIDKFTIFYSKK